MGGQHDVGEGDVEVSTDVSDRTVAGKVSRAHAHEHAAQLDVVYAISMHVTSVMHGAQDASDKAIRPAIQAAAQEVRGQPACMESHENGHAQATVSQGEAAAEHNSFGLESSGVPMAADSGPRVGHGDTTIPLSSGQAQQNEPQTGAQMAQPPWWVFYPPPPPPPPLPSFMYPPFMCTAGWGAQPTSYQYR